MYSATTAIGLDPVWMLAKSGTRHCKLLQTSFLENRVPGFDRQTLVISGWLQFDQNRFTAIILG